LVASLADSQQAHQVEVLEDHSGLSPFEVVVPARSDASPREIVVLVDNRFNYQILGVQT